MDAIAVVLAFEDYQNSIAKNLRVRDLFSHPSFFFTRPGRGGNLFVHQTGETS